MNEARQVMPKARKDRLIIKEIPDETLVYDLDADLAHCLNTTANEVWKRCDGSKSVNEIGKSIERDTGAKVDDKVVWLALEQLEKHKLLSEFQVPSMPFTEITRRQLIRKLGVGAVALPLIVSIVVPMPTMAQSCVNPGGRAPGAACGSNNQCCSNRCCGSAGTTPCSPNNTCL